MKSEIIINKNYTIGQIDPRLYGSFVEHIGRVVYNGIYEPGHESADDMGFRKDVLAEVRSMDIPIVRYPGGNFLSAYNWEDGTGDKSLRKTRLDPAWNSLESNEVGIDEFQEWARRASTSVMMAVNLGTRGAQDACNCVEYCNATTPTYWAEKRRKNGFDKPFGFKTWCLGNEMGGISQIGRKTPEDYGKLAADTAKLMKKADPSIELVVCGSSHRNMPRFGEWELTVLDHTYPLVDYLSIHQYYSPEDGSADFLAKSLDLDSYIKSVVAMCDSIKAIKRESKKMLIAFDEWGVFGSGLVTSVSEPQKAPHLFECDYTFEDALVIGCMMMTLQNNCDRVKIACLAQLVNAIAPIMTENGGKLWRQTIFYPFMLASRNGRGVAMRAVIKACEYSTSRHSAVPYLESSVIHNEEKREITIFCVNRSLDTDMELDAHFEDFGEVHLLSHTELYSEDIKAKNSAECEKVYAVQRKLGDKTILKKHSWNMLKYTY